MIKTVEEKAKAYDEAKYIMKEYLKSGNAGVIAENTIKKAFPELSESEDERIRKKLLEYFKSFTSETFFCGVPTSDAIAWLEKQGEKPIDKIQLGKKYKCIASPRYSTFMIGKIYKPEDKFLCSLMNFCSDCFEPIEDGEQNPVDNVEKPWSEDDNKHFERILKELKNQWQRPSNRPYLDEIVSDYYWLNSIKDRVQPQPKQEWSEEDEKYINDLIAYFAADMSLKHTEEDIVNWLKSLRPQSQWKPSDEQMEAIKDAIEFLGCTKKVREDLKSLYEQMKKLMEE